MIHTKKRSMLKYVDYIPFGSDKQKRKLVNSLYHTFRTDILPSISISVFHKHDATAKSLILSRSSQWPVVSNQ